MIFEEKVTKLIEKSLQERPDIFMIELNISDNNDIHLVLDGDSGVNIDDIVFFSRSIEHNLDREEEDFSLTVSSVDITKPFFLKRQYQKNLNKTIKIKTDEGELKGNLIAIEDEYIILENKIREPKKTGKGKVTVTKQYRIEFDKIKEAKVVLKF
jgi:ribosome maturation factor RimP